MAIGRAGGAEGGSVRARAQRRVDCQLITAQLSVDHCSRAPLLYFHPLALCVVAVGRGRDIRHVDFNPTAAVVGEHRGRLDVLFEPHLKTFRSGDVKDQLVEFGGLVSPGVPVTLPARVCEQCV